ncbi:MAG TPA: energy transducer TonB [Candidatus Elarobacter sp.]
MYFDKTTCTQNWEPAKAAAFPSVSAFGVARLDVFVNDHGTVDRVQLVEGDAHSDLVKQLLAAAPKMKFTPARCDGKIVAELDHLSYRISPRPADVKT